MVAAVEAGTPVGFGLGSIANDTGWIRAFVVRAERRREGIGTRLFQAIEDAFSGRGVSEINVGWAPPRYLLPGIDIAYTAAVVFLDSIGYETNRETRVNMDVVLGDRDLDTAQEEARLEARKLLVRRAWPSDRPGVVHLCESHSHLNWAIETSMALDRDIPSIFIATRDDEVCAFAAHSVCGPIHFGPMLTAAELRGQGIGSVLLKRCLLDWQQAGVARCEIMWAGPLSFYARVVGATIGRAFWTFHKSLS
jgi:GNAT superfamily N-acetyltransferase